MKSNMSHDELKRVSQERDTLKGKLAVAEVKVYEAEDALKKRNAVEFAPKAENEGEQEENDVSNAKEGVAAQARSSLDSQKTESATKSPLLSGMSRSTLSIFSPKKQPLPDPPANEEPEEFFSFDKEVPRLESELEERQKEVSTLQSELATLKHDLSSAQESTHSMAQNLEQTTREVNSLREQKEVLESELFKEKADSGSKVSDLRSQLEAADAKLRQIADEAQPENLEKTKANQKLLSEAQAELDRLRASSEEYTKALDKSRDLQGKVDALEKELSGLKEHKIKPEESDRKLKSLKAIADKLTVDLNCARREKREMESELRVSSESIAELKRKLQDIPESTRCKTDHGLTEEAKAKDEQAAATAPEQESGPGKKKNKKKKKAAKAQEENATNEPNNAGASSKTASLNEQATQLQNRNQELEALLATKEETIVKLQAKLKDQDDLKEEIESLRDDLVNLGGDHVDAKDKVKQLQTEKSVLESSLADAVKDAADLQAAQALAKGESTEAHKELKTQFEDLKVTAAGLQPDLAVAQQLASARFKDLTDLRTVLQKAQPEMASLKEENTSLKALRDELNGKVSDLLRVEAKHTVLRGELQELRKRIGERDTEMKTLNQRLTQERASRDKSDDSYSKATQRLQSLESEKKQLTTTLEQHVNDVRKSNDELAALKAQLRNLEASMSRLEKHNTGLKEDLELKTAQHVSAESLITSMRDQAAEMAVQKREAQEKCDSLEEEVADAHRLLGERGREAETMRRLLSETEGRADARMRDMKERMDTAVEERDKAEDEASTIGRRRARELEDARNKFREAERSLKRVEEEKEELELVEKDWKRRREELEKRAEASTREAGEVRKAMGSLRDALDESEKQARTLEREKSELRRAVEETQQRLERLQKSNKVSANFSVRDLPLTCSSGSRRRGSGHPSQVQASRLANRHAALFNGLRPIKVQCLVSCASTFRSIRSSEWFSARPRYFYGALEERAAQVLGAEGQEESDAAGSGLGNDVAFRSE